MIKSFVQSAMTMRYVNTMAHVLVKGAKGSLNELFKRKRNMFAPETKIVQSTNVIAADANTVDIKNVW
jgi:hypothetical protein